MSESEIIWLTRGKLQLALHRLRSAQDENSHPLLLLHGLGEKTVSVLPDEYTAWRGSILGLDFTGHGLSQIPVGGGYTAEALMSDADSAVAELGEVTLCGRGLGAYVALLLAGGRPREILGTILCDGPGLAGGGSQPSSPRVIHPDPMAKGAPDPFALAELSTDLRPPDYAMSYVRQISQLGRLESSLTVCAVHRPEWLQAVAEAPDTEEGNLVEALERYSDAERTDPI